MLRRFLPLVMALLLVVVPITAATGQDVSAEQAFLDVTNVSRAELGLPALVLNSELTGIARGWTAEMAAAGGISHNPNYAQSYTGEWSQMGENVGITTMVSDLQTAVNRVQSAFLDSPSHQANIAGDYNQAGIGATIDQQGVMWVTVNFLQGPVPPADVAAAEQSNVEPVVQEEPVQQTRAAIRTHFTRA